MSSVLLFDERLTWAQLSARVESLQGGQDESPVRVRRVDVLSGDEFERIYAEYARPLWGYLCRITRSAATADDLVQESFCRFLEAPASPSDARALRAYLFRIAGNLAIDHARKHKREVAADPGRELAAPTAGVEAGVGVDLGRLFARLRPRERSLLWLAHVEEMSHAEIAAASGLATASVRVLLFRARRHMRKILESEGLDRGVLR
jgi:RNA polymerase sigma-70 factor (ECF subfamily)